VSESELTGEAITRVVVFDLGSVLTFASNALIDVFESAHILPSNPSI